MKKLRYVYYGRVSSMKQKEEDTIEMQKIALKNYSKANNLTVVDEYYDEAQSGTLPFEDRPEGKRLLEDAQLGKFDAVLYYRTDRLGRSAYEGLRICKILTELNVSICSITENYDTSTPMGKMVYTILLTFAENELASITKRMTAGRHRKLKEGKYVVGKPPYGYIVENQYLKPDTRILPGTSYTRPDIIRMIFEKTAYEGYSQIKLAAYLDAIGVPAPYEKEHWFLGDINNFLNNTKYKGEMIVKTNNGTETYIVSVPPFVSSELYDAAHEAAQKRLSSHKRTGTTYLLNQGILRCGYCGQAYSGFRDKYRAYYRCVGRIPRVMYYSHRTRCHKGKQIAAEYIEPLIWEQCKSCLQNPDLLEKKLRQQLKKNPNICTSDNLESQIQALIKKEKELKAERKRLVEHLVKKRITEDEFDEFSVRNKITMQEVSKKLEELSAADLIDIDATIAKARVYYAKLATLLNQSESVETKYYIIHSMVEKSIITTRQNQTTVDTYFKSRDFIVNKKKH